MAARIAGNPVGLLVSRVIASLQKEFGLQREDAREHTHQAFVNVWDHYRRGNFDPKAFQQYLYVSARREYFSYHAKITDPRWPQPLTDKHPHPGQPPNQLQRLYKADRQRVLQSAIDRLDPDDQRLMRYLLAYPDEPLKKSAGQLGLSYTSLRTRKTRIVQELRKTLQSTPARPKRRITPLKKDEITRQMERLQSDFGNNNISLQHFVRLYDRLEQKLQLLKTPDHETTS